MSDISTDGGTTELPPYVRREVWPEGREHRSITYETIVASWGYEVLAFTVTGSYQGDQEVLLRDGDRYGFLMIGYGSCSGCDALEAIVPWDLKRSTDFTEVDRFVEDLRNEIEWHDSAAQLANALTVYANNPDGSRWYTHDSEVRDVLVDYIRLLEDRTSA